MRYLFDENLSEPLAPAMAAIALPGEAFDHVVPVAGRSGATDDEVVELCERHCFDVLITLNVRDFGAKKHYYAALNKRGIHVVVARAKNQPDTPQQLALVSAQFNAVRKYLCAATGAVLIVLKRESARPRTLDELLEEIEGHRRLP